MLLVKTSRLLVEPSVTQRLVAKSVLPIVFGPWDTQLYIVFINCCSDMMLVSTTLVRLLSSINISSIIGYSILWIWYRVVSNMWFAVHPCFAIVSRCLQKTKPVVEPFVLIFGEAYNARIIALLYCRHSASLQVFGRSSSSRSFDSGAQKSSRN